MSSTLMWKPVKDTGKSLSDDLKYAIRKRWFDSGEQNKQIMGESDIPYLAGMRDAGIKDAQFLIKQIEKYKTVVLWLEY